MRLKHLYEESNYLKGLLKPFKTSKEMLDAFNAYMLKEHQAVPGSEKYKETVNLYKEKAGLKGFLEFMGV